MLIQQIQPVNAGPQSRPCSTCWDAHFLKMNAAWKIWQLLMRRLSTVQEPGQTYDSVRRWWTRKKKLTLPKWNSHKSNNRLRRRSIQVFSLFSTAFYPTKLNFLKSKLFLQSQQIRLRQSWLYLHTSRVDYILIVFWIGRLVISINW